MAISGLPVNLTAVAPDTSTATAAAAAKSKAAAPSVTPQDTVTISSQAQLSPAGAIDVAPPVLLVVEELLTQGLSASQIAVTLKMPFITAEAYTEIAQAPGAAHATGPAAVSDKITL